MPDEASYRRADDILAQVDLGDWDVLLTGTEADLGEIYGDGLVEGQRLTGLDVSLDQVNERAVDWARDRAASLVTMIEENTRDMLRTAVATAVEEGWSATELADEVEAAGFSDDRALTIARTEIIASNNAGNMTGYRDAQRQGVRVMKEWMTAGDDLVSEGCEENEDEGPIDLDEMFPSGDDAPPAHTNCRCAVVPYLPDEEGEEGEEDEE